MVQKLVVLVAVVAVVLYVLSNYEPFSEEAIKRAKASMESWKQKGDYFEYKGNKLFYVDLKNDNKEVLLVLHGYPTSSWDFIPLLPNLTQKFHVVLFDFIGYGFSDKPKEYNYTLVDSADTALHLLKKLNIHEFHLIAHDVGVSVAQELLARKLFEEPGSENYKVKSVAFLNGGLFSSIYRPLLIQTLMLNPYIGWLLHYVTSRALFVSSMKRVFGPQTQPSEYDLIGYWDLINYKEGTRIQYLLIRYMLDRSVNEQRWTEVIKKPIVPMRLINGPYDPISGAHVPERYKTLAPNGGDIVMLNEKIGHYPQVEAPAEVAKALFDFWNKLGL